MWFGFNVLSSSVSETAAIVVNSTKKFSLKNLCNSGAVHFLNVSVNKIAYFKKIIELQLLYQKNIFCVLSGDDVGGFRPHLTLGMGNYRLMIKPDDKEKALEVLQILEEEGGNQNE